MSDLASLQRRFAAHLRDPQGNPPPEGIEDRRLAIYRRLFFNNIENFLSNAFPVLHSLYTAPDWQRLCRAFFARHQSQGPQFWHIAGEFLSFLDHEYEPGDSDPPFLLELAHYEWIELILAIDASPRPLGFDPQGELLAGAPVLAPWARVLSYRYPVHLIGPDHQPASPPEEATHLVVWRRPDDEIGFLQINALTARLLAAIEHQPERSGRDHLEELAALVGMPAAQMAGFGLDILTDLHARGVILGTRPPLD